MSDSFKLKRILCPKLPRPGASVILSETEAHHALRVLRLRNGSQVQALDGNGNQVQATLKCHGERTELEYTDAALAQPCIENVLPLVLEVAILKGEAMEWVVEKAVELGVKRLIPVLTKHTVVQMKSKGPESFQTRWQKIADQALKQCGRLSRMEIALPTEFEALLTPDPTLTRLWCDEYGREKSPYLAKWIDENNSTLNQESLSLHILIGPEGGFSAIEREILLQENVSDVKRVHLGPAILRAETAALFAISVISSQMRLKNAKI
jgi:16S rRNA (uracil1498-N3)-methyltransferase